LLIEDEEMERKPSKDEALETLDFIINVLKEHEKDLDHLVGQLGIITESLGETGEISSKIEKIEDHLSSLQAEIANLISYRGAPRVGQSQGNGCRVIVTCRQWQEFKNLAEGAETVSYLFKEAEKSFQADALKKGRVVSYSGDLPQNAFLLKLWLSKELGVAEKDIFEGVLGIV
jgi:hypothetical protein